MTDAEAIKAWIDRVESPGFADVKGGPHKLCEALDRAVTTLDEFAGMDCCCDECQWSCEALADVRKILEAGR